MLPLVEIPPFVKKQAKGYQDWFSPEQFEHFRRYLTGLLVSENKTLQALNGAFVVEVKHQSSLNRFFTEYPQSATAVNEHRLELVRKDTATTPKKHAVLIIDIPTMRDSVGTFRCSAPGTFPASTVTACRTTG